ncbi:tail fiber assembly protein [Rahnella sp. PD12R]|uniref:tail fiber assembly protein n=1 Tax=Rahnella sp. PD12R TaxID=2855688 RepID=UPI001C43FDB7|nr:tail fiber assembly protein [Rahnella sp. PD12R]MBV6817496.1 tail fiber assembly protein [Rahnella sp. PD12R]
MNNYAVVESGIVTNIATWDGESDWSPSNGQSAIKIKDGETVGIGYSVVDGEFTAPAEEELPKEELISQANIKKQLILQGINDTTQIWQTQLSLGIITSTDKEKLTNWMKYAQLVDAVDISTAPDILWPTSP